MRESYKVLGHNLAGRDKGKGEQRSGQKPDPRGTVNWLRCPNSVLQGSGQQRVSVKGKWQLPLAVGPEDPSCYSLILPL